MSTEQVTRLTGAIVRSGDEEERDRQNAVRHAVAEAYLNWPNEAGFTNLDEHRGPIELQIQGHIPSWAAGSLFRTGPGINQLENNRGGTLHISHWFDGLAHTHRFDIIAGSGETSTKVIYYSRRQCDGFITHARRNGIRDLITFGQRADPCVGIFGKIMSTLTLARPRRETYEVENIGVTVQLDVPGLPSAAKPLDRSSPAECTQVPPAGYGNALPQQRVWLGTDSRSLREIDRHTLEPIGFAQQKTFHKTLDGPLTCAHAQWCPKTGDYFNVNVSGGFMATYTVFRVSKESGKTQIIATISRSDVPMAYIHSFYLSNNFIVLRVPSSYISARGLSILWKRNLLDAMEAFDESKKNKWFIIDRVGGRGVVAEFETEAAFFFHSVNCFDDMSIDPDGVPDKISITCDTVEYHNMNILNSFYYDVLLKQDGKAKAVWGTEAQVQATLPWLRRWIFAFPASRLGSPSAPQSRSFMIHKQAKAATAMACEAAYDIGRAVRKEAGRFASILWVIPPLVLSWFSSRSTVPLVLEQEPLAEEGNEEEALQDPRSTRRYEQTSTNTINIPSPHVGELPTINPAYHASAYRYVYSLAMSGRSTLVDTILKTDMISRTVLEWDNPVGHTPGEAIFVGQPGGTEEDDGVLLSVVLDGGREKSYLLCLDARSMTEVGRAEMDFAVGHGFHGVHAPDIPPTASEEDPGDEK